MAIAKSMFCLTRLRLVMSVIYLHNLYRIAGTAQQQISELVRAIVGLLKRIRGRSKSS